MDILGEKMLMVIDISQHKVKRVSMSKHVEGPDRKIYSYDDRLIKLMNMSHALSFQ